MWGLDNFKTATKETGSKRNAIPMENAKNLMEWKKSNETKEADTTRPHINRIFKGQATFIGLVMIREKLEHLVIEGNATGENNEKRCWMD